ncbi:MAG: hypothetical protein ABSF53_21420, partial [Terracidiphilus sp.]
MKRQSKDDAHFREAPVGKWIRRPFGSGNSRLEQRQRIGWLLPCEQRFGKPHLGNQQLRICGLMICVLTQ